VGRDTKDETRDEDEFRWRAIGYLEARIALLDNKANVILALLSGVGAILLLPFTTDLDPMAATVLALVYVPLIVLASAWLHVIRPPKGAHHDDHHDNAMWLEPVQRPKLDSEPYTDSMEPKERRRALITTHMVILKQASKKYWYYRRAMRWTKPGLFLVFVFAFAAVVIDLS
jgi:hypothetical protein